MTTTPVLRPMDLCLHIRPDTGFVDKFGARVRAIGGKYTDVRGRNVSTRYVTLPDGHPDLVDGIVDAYAMPTRTTFVVKDWVAAGLDARLTSALSHAENRVVKWTRSSGLTPSGAVDAKAASVAAAFDWRGHLATWKAEDDALAMARRERALRADMQAVLLELGGEALRVLDGANDIDRLKEVALRYRGILSGLGIEEGATPPSP